MGIPRTSVIVIPGKPIAKPRMTQRDRWMKRPAVVAYWAWANHARELADAVQLGEKVAPTLTVGINAFFGLPSSYSAAKKRKLYGQPHTLRPDADNIAKAVLDALWPKNDSAVYDLRIVKLWDDRQGPRVEVTVTNTTTLGGAS